MGRSREGVSKKGHPLPLLLILPLFAVFLPFASVWKRKGNGCYAGYQVECKTTFTRVGSLPKDFS